MTKEGVNQREVEAMVDYIGRFKMIPDEELDFGVVLAGLGIRQDPDSEERVEDIVSGIINETGRMGTVLPSTDGSILLTASRIVPVLRSVVLNANRISEELGMDRDHSDHVFGVLQEAIDVF